MKKIKPTKNTYISTYTFIYTYVHIYIYIWEVKEGRNGCCISAGKNLGKIRQS